MKLTQAEYDILQARHNKRETRRDWNNEVYACEDEGKLHEAILQDCRRRGWLAFHGAMSHRTFRTPGEPDFVVLTGNGGVLLVECKAKGRKLRQSRPGLPRGRKNSGTESMWCGLLANGSNWRQQYESLQ